MFTVRHKSNDFTYTVYAVDRRGISARFLMWDGRFWRWEDADSFVPVDDNS